MAEEQMENVDVQVVSTDEEVISVEEFKGELGKLEAADMAKEIFWWLNENVKNFVDTQKTFFPVTFLADEEKMPTAAKVEALCRNIDTLDIKVTGDPGQMGKEMENNPEVKKAAEKQEIVNEYMEAVRLSMMGNKEELAKLLKTFAFYHEFVGFDKEGGEILKDTGGYVEIEYLSFENMEMEVSMTPIDLVKNENGEVISAERDEANTTILGDMPAAFSIDIVAEVWENKGEQSIF